MADRPQHPSKRPIRLVERRGLSICRDPGRGPLISRLRDAEPRDAEPRDAIGFHHIRPADDEDEG